MGLYFTSLNSGSNGNCYYIGNEKEAVLVDAGLSCRETERRMKRLDLDIKKVKAIFVSHEHTDHVKGLAGIAGKYQLPVYVTNSTRTGCYHLDPKHAVHFNEKEKIQIGELLIEGFRKFHDAADPHSFIISGNKVTVGVFTDLGRPCEALALHFRKCHAAFLEANYDEEMLDKGRYPHFLKNRIRGGHGHLSNAQALNIFNAYRSPHLRHLLLAHLSADNNCPELVERMFMQHAGKVQITVASRYAETPVFYVSSDKNNEMRKSRMMMSAQMSLF